VIFAGLLTEPFAVVMIVRTGQKKLSVAGLVRFLNPFSNLKKILILLT
jgi:hypothetical protein